jgi:hypothetical protein
MSAPSTTTSTLPATKPSPSFSNDLDFSVTVYDSFSTQDKSNYFGTLTLLATVPAKTTAPVKLIHDTSVLIVYNATTNAPLARLISSTLIDTTPFGVGPDDVTATNQTTAFIALVTQKPSDPVAKAFRDLWKDSSKSLVTLVNQFFAQHADYAKCTFATYMMGITTAASQATTAAAKPTDIGKPLDQVVYSLSTAVKLLGGDWPQEFPDIDVTKFTCNTDNDVLDIRAGIDLKKLPPWSDQQLKFFMSLFNVQQLEVMVKFNYGFGLDLFGTSLVFSADVLKIPVEGSTLTIKKPTVAINIMPLFKFVVFTIKGSIDFTIFNHALEADVSLVIDNVEASTGVDIKGAPANIKQDQSSLPAPPEVQGVHFNEFGIGLGVLFEPPGFAIGVQGKLQIGTAGSSGQVTVHDDQFAVVCGLVDGVPNPLYVSFYVSQMDLKDVLAVFVPDLKITLDVSGVTFTDLSFQWLENPMQPVALPDGSLSKMAYGFSAGASIFGWTFFGKVEIDLTTGLLADIEMSPLTLGSIFSLKGDGKGVSIQVDADGNPIKNNLLRTTAAQKKALATAKKKQLVDAGGAVLKIQTAASPFLHLNFQVSLFELVNVSLSADITASGINFELDFGAVITARMKCALTDWHNFSASFSFGIDHEFSLGSLGTIHVQAGAGVRFEIKTSTSDISLSVGGSFQFGNAVYTFGVWTLDIHIQAVSDLIKSIISSIGDHIMEILGNLVHDAVEWAKAVGNNLIKVAESVASVLHTAFQKGAEEVASIMQQANHELNDIAGQLKSIFHIDEIASAIKNVFKLSPMAITDAFKAVGYAVEEVTGALKSVLGSAVEDIKSIAISLQTVFEKVPDQINNLLKDVGFDTDKIKDAFNELGGDFGKVFEEISTDIGDPSPMSS